MTYLQYEYMQMNTRISFHVCYEYMSRIAKSFSKFNNITSRTWPFK